MKLDRKNVFFAIFVFGQKYVGIVLKEAVSARINDLPRFISGLLPALARQIDFSQQRFGCSNRSTPLIIGIIGNRQHLFSAFQIARNLWIDAVNRSSRRLAVVAARGFVGNELTM